MQAGRIKKAYTDRAIPQGLFAEKMFDLNPKSEVGNMSLFGNAAFEYIEKYTVAHRRKGDSNDNG
jgi:sterol carrier protein 2